MRACAKRPVVMLVLGTLWLAAGCETDSARSPVVIDPGQARMHRGQEQEFVASGGYDYEWSIENRGLGTLTRTRDSHRVIYTATAAPEEGTETQVLRVTSRVAGASGSAGGVTNQQGVAQASGYQVQAEAYITHLADPEKPVPSEVEDLFITPAAATLETAGASRTFSVSGGRPEYRWSLSDASLGTLNASGRSAIYTRGPNAGSLFIRVTDGTGQRTEAAIVQPEIAAANNADDAPPPVP